MCASWTATLAPPPPPNRINNTDGRNTAAWEHREHVRRHTAHNRKSKSSPASEICGKPRDFIAQPQQAQNNINLAEVLSDQFFLIMAFKLHCVRLYFFFFIFLPFNK